MFELDPNKSITELTPTVSNNELDSIYSNRDTDEDQEEEYQEIRFPGDMRRFKLRRQIHR